LWEGRILDKLIASFFVFRFKRRTILSNCRILLVLGGIMLYASLLYMLVERDRALENLAGQEIIVTSGDTLWSIAESQYMDGRDIRELVYVLKKVNHLDGGSLQIGQKLIVPAEW
jgi:hypothetical protein